MILLPQYTASSFIIDRTELFENHDMSHNPVLIFLFASLFSGPGSDDLKSDDYSDVDWNNGNDSCYFDAGVGLDW